MVLVMVVGLLMLDVVTVEVLVWVVGLPRLDVITVEVLVRVVVLHATQVRRRRAAVRHPRA